MSLVINFFAGPGAGKSLKAAELYCALKKQGSDAELAMEAIKPYVYSGETKVLDNQLQVFALEAGKIDRLYGHVEYIVTDSPKLLSIVYDKKQDKDFAAMVMESAKKNRSVNIYLERNPEVKYQNAGRVHTELEAKTLDRQILRMLKERGVRYYAVRSDENTVDKVLDIISRVETNRERNFTGLLSDVGARGNENTNTATR